MLQSIKRPLYLLATCVVGSTLIIGIALVVLKGDRRSAYEKFREKHTTAVQIVRMPNGTFQAPGQILWHRGEWGEFKFIGLEGTVELPFDGKPTRPRTGILTITVSSGQVRVKEFTPASTI